MTKIFYFLYSFIIVLCFLACPKQSETSSSPDLSRDLSPEEIHAVLTKNLGQIKSDKNLVLFLAHKKSTQESLMSIDWRCCANS